MAKPNAKKAEVTKALILHFRNVLHTTNLRATFCKVAEDCGVTESYVRYLWYYVLTNRKKNGSTNIKDVGAVFTLCSYDDMNIAHFGEPNRKVSRMG